MKKIAIIFLLVISGIAFGQSDNPYVYDEPETSIMEEGDNPAGPGDPNPVPIDHYVPVLFIIAAVFTSAYGKRKSITTN